MKGPTSLLLISLTAACSLSAQFASSPFVENFDGSGTSFNSAFWLPQVPIGGQGGVLSQGGGVLNWSSSSGLPNIPGNSQALPSVCFVPFGVSFTVSATVRIDNKNVFEAIPMGGDVALGIGVFSGRELLGNLQASAGAVDPSAFEVNNNIGIEGLVFNSANGGTANTTIRVQSDASAAGADPVRENGEQADELGDIEFPGTSATIQISIRWDSATQVMTTAIDEGDNADDVLDFLNLPEAWGNETLGDFGTQGDLDFFGINAAGFATDTVENGEIVMEGFSVTLAEGGQFVHIIPEPGSVAAVFGLVAFAGVLARRRLSQGVSE